MGDKQQQKDKVVAIASTSLVSFVRLYDKTVAIDIIQLHVDEIKLFHYLFEIGEIVEVDEVVKEEEEEEEKEEHEEKELYMGDLPINFTSEEETQEEEEEEEEEKEKKIEKEEQEEEEESVSAGGVLEDPPLPLEYPAEEISQLFDTINELNLGVYILSALIGRRKWKRRMIIKAKRRMGRGRRRRKTQKK
ncbi:hypothetical protein G5I_00853 [Acromyrmex echinatior]|uniref:Uncharacterized protein n=1 Tax=Acromyrmex echinatior TaxID=103372 RepID=F4W602_ACREC|nr:hypothetical protein G5I_00853 [Acromyrmex echinatior]